jgi:hypothetical protein
MRRGSDGIFIRDVVNLSKSLRLNQPFCQELCVPHRRARMMPRPKLAAEALSVVNYVDLVARQAPGRRTLV